MDRAESRAQAGSRAQVERLGAGGLALVFAGGAAGAGLREVLGAVAPEQHPVPVAILIANLVGAALLGALLEALSHRQTAGATRARLLLGTGLLGGFTTYSALALGVARMLGDGRPWVALAYGGGTVLLGAIATTVGIRVGARIRRHRIRRRRGRRATGGA